jgi:hypothetical protein
MTGLVLVPDTQRFRAAGFDGHVAKAVKRDILTETIMVLTVDGETDFPLTRPVPVPNTHGRCSRITRRVTRPDPSVMAAPT